MTAFQAEGEGGRLYGHALSGVKVDGPSGRGLTGLGLRVLRFDSGFAAEGCGGRLCRQFVENLYNRAFARWKTGNPPFGRGKPYNRACGARKCTPSAYGTSPGGGGFSAFIE